MLKMIPLLGIIIWISGSACLPFVRQNAPETSHDFGLMESAPKADINDPQAVSDFFDGFIPRQMDERHIPGAAVAFVKDGKVVFSRGYGYADVATERLMDADQTILRTGSVAKLFVWSSIMQLAEQDKLDLHTDVNQYLDGFQIPDTYPEPITLAHLMTHTAGFEDKSVGMMRASTNDLEPLENYLASRIPARVFRPGQVTAYSNYGAALAGHIVEKVSGQPFEEYVEQNILTPLGMLHTTFRQPVPDALAVEMASGYLFDGKSYVEQPFETVEIAPAGSASASVNDMAKFMLMHLSGGVLNGKRIFQKETSQEMLQPHFHNDSRLTGAAYGFYQLRVNNRMLLTHAGDLAYFRTQVFLLPEDNMGFYVVYNAPGGGPARMELAQSFFDRFYPVEKSNLPQPLKTAISNTNTNYSGKYVTSRSNQTTLEKIITLFEPMYQPISISTAVDGTLVIIEPLKMSQNPADYKPGNWLAIQPGYFIKADGTDRVVLKPDDYGNQMLYFDSLALRGYRKLGFMEEVLFQPIFPILLVLLLAGISVRSILAKNTRSDIRWLSLGVVLMPVLFFIGLAAFGVFGFTSYLYGQLSPVWIVVFSLPVLYVGLTIALIIRVVISKTLWKIINLTTILCASGLIVWMSYWNLIGWKF